MDAWRDDWEIDGHRAGDEACPECIGGYPMTCRCGALIHARHTWEGECDYICDRCGENWEWV